jgi:hypothetical protein
VTVSDSNVSWDDFFARGKPSLPGGLRFVFERRAYEKALTGVASKQPTRWVVPSD